MRSIIILSVFIVIIFPGCKQKENKIENRAETPKALQDHKEASYIISKRGDNVDLVENLYNELVEKTPELKKLETDIEALEVNKQDSTAAFELFDQKNKSYYTAAKQHTEQVKDSALRSLIRSMIDKSDSNYVFRSEKFRTLIASINSKQSDISDMHVVLKIVKTMPLIEKYQGESNPSIKSIEQVKKGADTLYQKIRRETMPLIKQ